MSATWQSPLHGQYGAGAVLGSCDQCEVPMRFGAVEKEYACVRNGVGLTDNSHYGKFRLAGPLALEAANSINLADISRWRSTGRHSLICSDPTVGSSATSTC